MVVSAGQSRTQKLFESSDHPIGICAAYSLALNSALAYNLRKFLFNFGSKFIDTQIFEELKVSVLLLVVSRNIFTGLYSDGYKG